MNLEQEKVPVAEQVEEIENVEEAIQTEYSLEPDGTIEKVEGETENSTAT